MFDQVGAAVAVAEDPVVLPGLVEPAEVPVDLERGCFAVSAQHYGCWVQVHRHGHQCRRQGRGAQLKTAPPLARRRHRHPQSIRYAPHPQPTDDAECQSMTNHLDLI
jgi:hypothetical protein